MRPSTTISACAGRAAKHSSDTPRRKFQPPCTGSMADHPTRSAYMVENTVELVERVVADDEFALARGRVLHGDLRTQLFAQLAFELANVRIDARRALCGRGLRLRSQALDQRFGLAHRQVLLLDQRADFG